MIIDFHTHTFPDKIAASAVDKLKHLSHSAPFTDGTDVSLTASMDKAGVDVSVILPVATSARQVRNINDAAAELNRRQGWYGRDAGDGGNAGNTGDTVGGGNTGNSVGGGNAGNGAGNARRLFSFGCIHPDTDGWEDELERIADAGLAGVKIHPPYQETDLDDPRYLRIIRRADELGLVTVTHAGFDIGLPQERRCTPLMARHVFEELGPVRLVLAHMGGWKVWEQVCEQLADTPAMLDTSFSTGKIAPLDDGHYKDEELKLLDPAEFVNMVKLFGADRLLFGTDSPWSGQSESIEWIKELPLADREKQDVLGGNACRLLPLLSER